MLCCGSVANRSSPPSLLGRHLQGTWENHAGSQVLQRNLTQWHCCHMAILQAGWPGGTSTDCKQSHQLCWQKRQLKWVLEGFRLHESQLEGEHEARMVTQNEALDHPNTFQTLWGETVPSCNTRPHWRCRCNRIPPTRSKIFKEHRPRLETRVSITLLSAGQRGLDKGPVLCGSNQHRPCHCRRDTRLHQPTGDNTMSTQGLNMDTHPYLLPFPEGANSQGRGDFSCSPSLDVPQPLGHTRAESGALLGAI